MNSSNKPAKPRLAYIDNLRIFLTMLVVCHHVAIGLGGPGLWYFMVSGDNGPVTTLVLAMFIAVNQAFFMSLFFTVSAFFTPISYDKKGPGLFLADRLKRLGLPLAVYFFAINPAVVYLARYLKGTPLPDSYSEAWGTGPLWFVFTLLLFSLAYVVVRQFMVAEPSERHFPTNRAILVFAVVMGAAAFLVRLRFPIGSTVLGLQLGFFPLYISMFVVGLWAFRNGWFDRLALEQVKLWFRVAAVCIGLFPFIMAAMQLSGALASGLDVVNGGMHWQAAVFAFWEPFVCVGISMKLITLFRERFNETNGLTKRMSASAYTVYIVHPFFVIVATWLVMEISIPVLAKVVIVALLAVPSCFVVANQLRKIPPLPQIV